ncbi:MAG: hypothetical protein PHE55_02145 [Methylococcaceae bacterium]|nr:hypothetical protein [Methylococcaceae bacterium]
MGALITRLTVDITSLMEGIAHLTVDIMIIAGDIVRLTGDIMIIAEGIARLTMDIMILAGGIARHTIVDRAEQHSVKLLSAGPDGKRTISVGPSILP